MYTSHFRLFFFIFFLLFAWFYLPAQVDFGSEQKKNTFPISLFFIRSFYIALCLAINTRMKIEAKSKNYSESIHLWALANGIWLVGSISAQIDSVIGLRFFFLYSQFTGDDFKKFFFAFRKNDTSSGQISL